MKINHHRGNIICKRNQTQLDWATTKINNAAKNEVFTGGLYAPTIRYHNGKFYIVCTFLTGTVNMPSDVDFAPENFLVTSTDLEDPSSFSDPVYFDFHGIDPSLFFDDDGRVYLQGSWIHGYRENPATVIRQGEFDPSTGRLLSPASDIWFGHTGKVPEGPHMYKKDGFYYLLIAEGGTHRGHKITMSRSKSIWGPFDSFEGNPVLTADDPAGCIQCIGHAELFQDTLGQWWAVMLARREYGSSYPLGRETYLTPVEWPENAFPTFAPLALSQKTSRPMAEKAIQPPITRVTLHSPSTIFLRSQAPQNYLQSGNGILLTPSPADLGAPSGTVTFVGHRQTSMESAAQATFHVNEFTTGDSSYGLTVYKDTFRYVAIEYSTGDRNLRLKVQQVGKPLETVSCLAIPDTTLLQLSIKSSIDSYVFEFLRGHTGGETENVELGTIPTSTLSGDDFTGTIYAVFATGNPDMIKVDFQLKN